MYEVLKKTVLIFIPLSFFRRNKSKFRSFVYLFYRGNKKYCIVCDKGLRKFITLSNGDVLCPNCGCLGRTRLLFFIIREDINLTAKILHFSPPEGLRKKIQSIYSQYITTDFENEFKADKRIDITAISESDNSYDCIICYHVLEHIEADKKAMSELYRILKNNGICYIQTPFKKGDIYEDFSMTTPEERLQQFGQKDHVRIYGVEGMKERLQEAGFEVEVLKKEHELENKEGFSASEIVIKAKKNNNKC